MAGPYFPRQSSSMLPKGISSNSFFPSIMHAILNRTKYLCEPGETCYWMFLEVQRALLQSCATWYLLGVDAILWMLKVLYWFLWTGSAWHSRYAEAFEKVISLDIQVEDCWITWKFTHCKLWHFLCSWLVRSRAILVTIQHLQVLPIKGLYLIPPLCSSVFISIY